MGNSQCQSPDCVQNIKNCKCDSKHEANFEEEVLISEEEVRCSFKEKILTPITKSSHKFDVHEVISSKGNFLNPKIEKLVHLVDKKISDDFEGTLAMDFESFDKHLNQINWKLSNEKFKLRRSSQTSNPPLEIIEELFGEFSKESKNNPSLKESKSNLLKNFDEESKRMLTANKISGYIRNKESRNNLNGNLTSRSTQSVKSNYSNKITSEDKSVQLLDKNFFNTQELIYDDYYLRTKSLSEVSEINESEAEDKFININKLKEFKSLNTQSARNYSTHDKTNSDRSKKVFNLKIPKKIQNMPDGFTDYTSDIFNTKSKEENILDYDIYSLIPKLKFSSPVKDEPLYQGELYKWSLSQVKNDDVFQTNLFSKYCLVTHNNLMIYKNKESFLKVNKNYIRITLKHVKEIERFSQNKNIKDRHGKILYSFYIRINEKSTNSTPSNSKHSTHDKIPNISDDPGIIFLASPLEDVVCKWISVLKYLILRSKNI